jgi:hypothetical protein
LLLCVHVMQYTGTWKFTNSNIESPVYSNQGHVQKAER